MITLSIRYPLGLLVLCLLGVSARGEPAAPTQYNVRAYGAKGDGITIDSPAINAAIEAAAASGGGTVHFPAGNYLSFSIRMKSHIALYLDAGATIVAATPPADLSLGS